MAKLLTTTEAAEELFISKRRVQALIKAERLPAKKVVGIGFLRSLTLI
jgi:excisionase family DNA binding protein